MNSSDTARLLPEASEITKYAERLIEDIDVLENGYEVTGLAGRSLAVYEADARMVARWALLLLERVDSLEAALRRIEHYPFAVASNDAADLRAIKDIAHDALAAVGVPPEQTP